MTLPPWIETEKTPLPRIPRSLLRGEQTFTTKYPEIQLPEPEAFEREVPWYEQPKMLTEKVMGGIAKGIERIPGAPKALEFISPPLEFIHEKLEKPWSAIITAPLSPKLPYRSGENWFEHEKREYEEWKAPTYVKGLAEFAMPLWWLPWLGWASKGAKALGVGRQITKGLQVMPKAGKFVLPTKEMLNTTLYKADPLRKFAWWAENKPILNRVVRGVGGESAFVKAESENALDIARREIVNRAVIRDMRHGAKGVMLPRLQKFGDPIKLLNIDENGIIMSATPLGRIGQQLGRGISEVIEHPQAYKFATKEQTDFVKEVRKIILEVRGLAEKEGVKVPKSLIYHRIVKGKEISPELAKKLGITVEPSEYGSLFEVARTHPTMEHGIKAGVKYGNNPIESISSTIDHYIRKIADKRFTDEVGKLGDTPMGKFASQYPEMAERIGELTTQRVANKSAKDIIQKVLSYKGDVIPPATMAKIRRGLPDIAQRIDDAFSITATDVDKMITAMGDEVLRAAKIKPKEFKEMLAPYMRLGKLKLGDVDTIIRQLNVEKGTAIKAITKIYKQAYKMNTKQIDDSFTALRNELDITIGKITRERSPLLLKRREFLQKYEGRQALGEMEARFRAHPVFRDKFFPKEVVDYAEKILGDKGQDWARNVAGVSGVSRMMTAALDFSAPFIQGLGVLGRNPIAWAIGVKKQFEFFINPRNMYKYMVSPEAAAIRAERVLYGGSASTFEFFQALEPLQKIVEKVPFVGKFGKRLIGETYGRAEAAFTGFGEVARNEMWKALRRPGMSDMQLRELSRTIDRMTSVMSTEALAIGVTQRDLESAFVFFAPRYTRAAMAFVGDFFRGGMTGAEARKAISALTASGVAFYSGVTAVLGQEPEFNPRSAKFMTIQVGDTRVGIGGILYGLLRLGAGVITTAGEEPADLIKPFKAGALNRFDNPFVKFMYQRTSPLTGLGIGLAVEQKNYLGEPFESPADWAKFMAEKVTPMAFERMMPWTEEKATFPVFLSEVAGGRTFPKSAWELREEARDKIAMQTVGQPYASLNDLQKREVDKFPEIEALQEEADVKTAYMGGLSYDFLRWRQEREDARLAYVNDLNSAQKAVDVGFMTPYEFKRRIQDAGKGLGATYAHINRNPEYKEILKKLDEPEDISKEYIGDVVYDLLQEARLSFVDEFGIPDYDEFDNFKELLRQKYGDAPMQYAEDRIWQKRQDLPPLAQEYFKAQEILKPYWQVQKEVEKIYGKPTTEARQRRVDRVVSRIRKRMRATDPELERMYNLFYKRV